MGNGSEITDVQRGLPKKGSPKPASGKVQILSRNTHGNGISSVYQVVFYRYEIKRIDLGLEEDEIKKLQLVAVFGDTILKDQNLDAMLKEVETGNLYDKDRINYKLNDTFFRKYKVLPIIKASQTFIVQGQNEIDIEPDLAFTVDLTTSINELSEDQLAILKDSAGDVLKFEYWDKISQDYFAHDIRAEMAEVIQLLKTLDDQAINSLFAELSLSRRSNPWKKSSTLIIHDKIVKLKSKLLLLKGLSESREIKSKSLEYDLALAETSLVGFHKLYFTIKELESITKTQDSPEVEGLPAPLPYYTPEDILKRQKLKEKIRLQYKKFGISESDFNKRQKYFVTKFESKTKDFAIKLLNKQQRLLIFERKRTDAKELGEALKNSALELFNINNFTSLEKLSSFFDLYNKKHDKLVKKFPIIKYVNFWDLVNKKIRPKEGFSESSFNVNLYRTIKANEELIKKFSDKSKVWDANILIENSIKKQNIISTSYNDHNAMLLDLIKEKERKESGLESWEIILIGLAIVLSFAGPLGMITAAGIGVFDVYRMIEDQSYAKKLKIAGFSSKSPPSDWWIIIAVVGVGLDAGSFIRSMSKMGRGAKLPITAEEIDDLVARKIIKENKIIKAIDAKKPFKKNLDNAILDLKKVAMSLGSINAAANEFSNVAYHLGKLGLIKFEHFILELSKRNILKRIDASIKVTDDFSQLMNKLSPDAIKFLRERHIGVLTEFKVIGVIDEVRMLVKNHPTLSKLGEAQIESITYKARKNLDAFKNPKSHKSTIHKIKGFVFEELMKVDNEIIAWVNKLKTEAARNGFDINSVRLITRVSDNFGELSDGLILAMNKNNEILILGIVEVKALKSIRKLVKETESISGQFDRTLARLELEDTWIKIDGREISTNELEWLRKYGGRTQMIGAIPNDVTKVQRKNLISGMSDQGRKFDLIGLEISDTEAYNFAKKILEELKKVGVN